ncbi:tetratricopeptide repeat protein [Flavobacterium chuncheonense]|uniref:Tetratricopeptide repeat protein n=1 Tax=Flavobacterium chuncheonense TaxID=2026653 RepID=A0ABW5YPE5_9FLAO
MRKILLLIFLYSICIKAQNMKLADSLMSIGQFSKAIVVYEKEGHYSKYFNIAKAYEAKGNSAEALKNYNNYLKNDTLNLQVNYNYGLLLLELSKNKEAQRVFQKLVQSNPNELYYYYLGLAFEKENDVMNSVVNFLHSAKIDSLYFKSNYKLAVYHTNGKNYKEALKITNRFLVKNASNIEMLKLRAQVYYFQSDFQNAIIDFNKLLSLNQTDTFILEKLANSYYGNKEYKEAITIYNSLIENATEENANYFYNRGKAYGFLEKTKAAEADIKKAIELKTFTFENEYFYLGYFYQKEHNLDRALYYYKKAIKQDKNHIEANYQVIAISDYKGDNPEKIIKDYENYLAQFKNLPEEKRFYIENRIKQLKRKLHME